MPSWITTWLSWSSIGASAVVGAGLLLAAGEDLVNGSGGAPLALAFGGLGFCTLAVGLLLRFTDTSL
jgi:hypothetical protein